MTAIICSIRRCSIMSGPRACMLHLLCDFRIGGVTLN